MTPTKPSVKKDNTATAALTAIKARSNGTSEPPRAEESSERCMA
jgi:hypothetical protein